MRTNQEALEHARWRPPDHITIQYTLHNHPLGHTSPSEADLQLNKRVVAAARILQINFLDHVIVGQAMVGGQGFFSFQEAGLFGLTALTNPLAFPDWKMPFRCTYRF